MAGDIHKALSNLHNAVYALATGAGDVRARLATAFEDFQHIREDDLPETLRGELTWIMNALTKRRPTMERSSLDETLHHMRNKTGITIARRIFVLYDELEGYLNE